MDDENLWGKLPLAENVETPLSLLRAQARLLEKLTSGLLEGRIITTQDIQGRMNHEFRLVVPALGNYSATFLMMRHPVELYPVDIFRWIGGEYIPTGPIKDKEAFRDALKEILQSDHTRRIVQSLVAQARESGTSLHEDRLATS